MTGRARIDEHGVTHAVAYAYVDVDGNTWTTCRDGRGHYVTWMRCGARLPGNGGRASGAVDCMTCLVKDK